MYVVIMCVEKYALTSGLGVSIVWVHGKVLLTCTMESWK